MHSASVGFGEELLAGHGRDHMADLALRNLATLATTCDTVDGAFSGRAVIVDGEARWADKGQPGVHPEVDWFQDEGVLVASARVLCRDADCLVEAKNYELDEYDMGEGEHPDRPAARVWALQQTQPTA
ncbi:hypothetical protein ABZV65_30595 [Streptomyces bauhiniae]|uniref:hypothetical protein n=1 Tax=Streptomyces bauhiniae TaxID=2340725 RepID=UPI0033B48F36